jgi:hypothetical protein
VADIKYVISVDSTGATKSIQAWDQALKEAQGTAGKAESAHAGLWKQFALGQIAVDAIKKSLSFMWGELKSTVTESLESEKAQQRLELALSTTGRTVDAMLPNLTKFADEIMRQTTVDDEAAKGAMALLTQITRLDTEGIQKATTSAIGLAYTFGVDLDTAARLVGRAMEGQEGALSKYNIQVDKNLPLEQQRIQILSQTAPMYEAAKGAVNTFGGSLTQLGNYYNKLKTKVGDAIIQNDTVKNGIKNLSDEVIKLTESDDFQLWLSIIVDGLMLAIEYVGKFAGACKDLTEWLWSVSKSDKEFTESQTKLNEALERARDAGHDLGNKVKALVGPLRDVKTEANETGNGVGELTKVITKLIDTGVPLGNLRTRFVELSSTLSNTVVPAARDMGRIIEQTVGQEQVDRTNEFWRNWEDRPKVACKEATNYVSLLMDDIRRGFAATITEWISGATTFKDFMKGLFVNVRDAFFGMIGEMIAEWTLNFLKNIVTGATSAFAEVAKGASNLVAGVGNALTGGLASGIGAFVGTFLGTLLGGGGGNNKDITYWLKMIKDNSQILVNYISADYLGMVHELVDGKNRMIDQNDWHSTLLGWIETNTGKTAEILGKVTFAQHGVDMTVTRPTMFMAGERGAERVTVAPNVNVNPKFSMEPTTLQVNIDGHPLMNILVKYLPEYTRAGVVKIHSNALVSY